MSAKTYLNLFVDARYEKVRVGHWVVSQRILIVSAVREDGFREILTVDVADTESEATYQELFRALKARGLKGADRAPTDEGPQGGRGAAAALLRRVVSGGNSGVDDDNIRTEEFSGFSEAE